MDPNFRYSGFEKLLIKGSLWVGGIAGIIVGAHDGVTIAQEALGYNSELRQDAINLAQVVGVWSGLMALSRTLTTGDPLKGFSSGLNMALYAGSAAAAGYGVGNLIKPLFYQGYY